jgi:septation ring formation regulator EzrA
MAWSETANGQQPWQSYVRIVDRWEWEDERVSALEDEIDRLTEAFELGELPFPRTDENVARFKARVEELRKTQSAAQIALQKRRDSNLVPAE